MTRTSHVQGKRGVVITFSGVDGAGKTTLLRELAHTLEVADRSVTCFTYTRDVGVLT
jgi:thymidylate kinase